jgi:hypothetical protein
VPPATYAQPPTSAPPRRFSTGAVIAGAAAVLLGLPLVGAAAVAVPYSGSVGWLGSVVALVAVAAVPGLLVTGIVLAAIKGTATRRGFGLGMVIGWGLLVIIGAGACIALLSQLGQ